MSSKKENWKQQDVLVWQNPKLSKKHMLLFIFIKLIQTRKNLKYTNFGLEEMAYIKYCSECNWVEMQPTFVQQILSILFLLVFHACFSLVRLMYHNLNRTSQQTRKKYDFHMVIKSAVTLSAFYTWADYWKLTLLICKLTSVPGEVNYKVCEH